MPQDNSPRREAAQTTDEVEQQTLAARDLEDRLLRAMADADNLRKRYARDQHQQRQAERDRVAAAWLPVVDTLERALAHSGAGSTTPPTDALLAGVLAVRDQAVNVLAQLGYPRHDEVGVPFDPARHEVVTMVDDPEQPPNTVVEVLLPGYGDP